MASTRYLSWMCIVVLMLVLAMMPLFIAKKCHVEPWESNRRYSSDVSPQDYVLGKVYSESRAPVVGEHFGMASVVSLLLCVLLDPLSRFDGSVLHRWTRRYACVTITQGILSLVPAWTFAICPRNAFVLYSTSYVVMHLFYLCSQILLARIALLRIELVSAEDIVIRLWRYVYAFSAMAITAVPAGVSYLFVPSGSAFSAAKDAIILIMLVAFAVLYLCFQAQVFCEFFKAFRLAYREVEEQCSDQLARTPAPRTSTSSLRRAILIVLFQAGSLLSTVFAVAVVVLSSTVTSATSPPSWSISWLLQVSVLLDVPLDVGLALLCAGLVGPEDGVQDVLRATGTLARHAELLQKAASSVHKTFDIKLGDGAIRSFEAPLLESLKLYRAAKYEYMEREPEAMDMLTMLPNEQVEHPNVLVQPTSNLDAILQDASEAQGIMKNKLAPNTSWATIANSSVDWATHHGRQIRHRSFGRRSGLVDWVDAAYDPGIKKRERIQNKADYKYKTADGDPHYERVRDVARLAVIFDTAARLVDALPHFKKLFDVVDVENRFRTPTALCWMDVTLLVRVCLANGTLHLAEIQLQLRGFFEQRLNAHKHYKFLRSELPIHGIKTQQVDTVVSTIIAIIDSSSKDPTISSSTKDFQSDVCITIEPDLCDVDALEQAVVNETWAHELLDLAKKCQWGNVFAKLSMLETAAPMYVDCIPHPRNFGLVHYAAHQDRPEVMRCLLESFGANLSLQAGDGRTASDIAIASNFTDVLAILEAQANQAADWGAFPTALASSSTKCCTDV